MAEPNIGLRVPGTRRLRRQAVREFRKEKKRKEQKKQTKLYIINIGMGSVTVYNNACAPFLSLTYCFLL